MDNDTVSSQPRYWALEFLVRYGDFLAPTLAVFVVALSFCAWLMGTSPIVALIGVGAAAFAYLMTRAFVELVRVIVDMLLPK